eukprot:13932105-Ditylum_brightwellii.AAC.1
MEIIKAKEGLQEVLVLWVKAHQDNIKQVNNLTLDACLNVIADTDVNTFRANAPPNLLPRPRPTVFPSNHAL